VIPATALLTSSLGYAVSNKYCLEGVTNILVKWKSERVGQVEVSGYTSVIGALRCIVGLSPFAPRVAYFATPHLTNVTVLRLESDYEV
jgi:hypothetical protein